jgi:hypothetical protein
MTISDRDALRLLDMSEDDLLLEIDRELSPAGLWIDTRPIGERVANGRKWLALRRTALTAKLCSSAARASLKEAAEGPGNGALLIAVADMIAGVVVGISPFTVAALLIKLGLDRLCSESPEAEV